MPNHAASTTPVSTATTMTCMCPTQRIWPTSMSFRYSPPCGLPASNRISSVAASTNTDPMIASWMSGQRFSVQVRNNAPRSAAASAAPCTAMPCPSQPKKSAAITPTPAICAIAMSMKTMPRFSTCIPSGAWVAVTNKPASKAGSSRLISRWPMLFFRRLESCDRVVEQAEQILCARGSSHGVRQFHHRKAGLFRERGRRLRILVGRTCYDIGGTALQTPDQIGQMTGAGRYSRLRFDIHDFHHAEPFDQIDGVLVVRHKPQPLQRRGVLLPTRNGLSPAILEVLAARLVVRRVGRIDLRETLREHLSDPGDIVRIKLDVRIAGRMDVAVRAIEPRWNFEPVNELGCSDESGLAWLNFLVSRGLLQHREPADFQLRTSANRQIGAAHVRNQARPRFDAVRVLHCIRRLVYRDFVAAEFGCQRCPFRQAGEDIHGGEGW